MRYRPIRFAQKFALIDEQWQPKVVAEMNDNQFKVVKLQGDFVWHAHPDTDEAFIVIDRNLRIDFRDGAVHLAAGEMFVVPKGVEHKPYAENEAKLLLIEPRGVPTPETETVSALRRTTCGFDRRIGLLQFDGVGECYRPDIGRWVTRCASRSSQTFTGTCRRWKQCSPTYGVGPSIA
jgi:mannose-6-phosphate isomerase-like protein (cupin superfamily)